MPLGFERINVRQNPPNDRIVFIKPLEGPDKETALDFLQRVAAICTPIMKKDYLSVVSLEEFEPNFEFVGRNFNAGEVIQLVLKSPTTGRWLPFHYVQMVMMHELAHCKQMNHSRAFWKVRNTYAGELRELWAKKYSGEGIWGRGQTLYDGQYTSDVAPDLKDLPEHLCGGTYKSSRRKRKRRTQKKESSLSYAERKQKRIAKKFGLHGTALGGDENIKSQLEKGRKVKGNPRVAKSARGRELRAAAALARLEQNTAGKPPIEHDASSDTEGDSDSDLDFDITHIKKEDAFDLDGHSILNFKGRQMVKICETENIVDDTEAKKEFLELGHIAVPEKPRPFATSSSNREDVVETDANKGEEKSDVLKSKYEQPSQKQILLPKPSEKSQNGLEQVQNTTQVWQLDEPDRPGIARELTGVMDSKRKINMKALEVQSVNVCKVCSLENSPQGYVCIACSNVLDINAIPNHWRCQNDTCNDLTYINHGDNSLCGLCGRSKLP